MDQPVPILLSCGLLEYVPYTVVPANPSVAGCQAFPAGTRRTNVQPLPYEPVAQAVHVPEFMSMKPTLHVQEVTTELGLGELEFAGHAIHVVAIVAPTVVEYVPAPQLVHAALPVVEYVPGPQSEHAALPVVEYVPAPHAIHVVATVAPTVVEYVPPPQSVHTTLPVVILYLPATQVVHTPPSGPVDPALHVQAVITELGLGELEFAGHARQVDSSVAPAVGEYLPAAQFTHALATL